VHRDELVQQAVAKLHAIAPHLRVGVVKAERNEFGPEFDAVVASVQTVGRESRRSQIHPDRFDRVIVDECHHAAARTYVETMEYFGCFTPETESRAIGFTATLVRGDDKVLGDVWQTVAIERGIEFGIFGGHLVDVTGRTVMVDGLDLSDVARTAGDYQAGALGDAMVASDVFGVTMQAYLEHGKDEAGNLRQGIAFWPSVAAALGFYQAANAAGIPTEVITGDTPLDVRADIYARVRSGETMMISNCMVLTEGFDLPQLSLAIIGRPTTNVGLYVQMVGRVLRTWPGKISAMVLDIVGVAGRLRLACPADLVSREGLTVEDGESLTDALTRLESDGQTPPAVNARVTGEITSQVVDLFKSSKSAWLRTDGGVWFIPTKSGYIFLSPDTRADAAPDTWLIGKTATQYRRTGVAAMRIKIDSDKRLWPNSPMWGWLRGGLPQEYAMAIAEAIATGLDASVSERSSAWRKKYRKPSEAQTSLCAREGLKIKEGMSRGDVGDRISIHFASRLLDIRSK
jgi:superfamily II DNA or RNA helicase